MIKKFFISVICTLAVAAGLAANVAAQGRHGHHSDWMLRRMIRELNLTDAQQTQIKSILQAEKAKIRPLRQQLRQNEQTENTAISGTFDETKARSFAGKQAQIVSDLMVERERMKSDLRRAHVRSTRQGPATHADTPAAADGKIFPAANAVG